MPNKILVSRRSILKAVAAATVVELLAACGFKSTAEPTPADPATPTTEPTKIPTPISTAQKSATSTPKATPIPTGPVIVLVPQPQPEIKSVIKGLNYGQVTPWNIVGMVPGNATPINTLYSPEDKPVVTKTQDGDREAIPARAFGIDQEFLKVYFRASTNKSSGITTGTTLEGAPLTLKNGIWTTATGETFIPFIKAQPGTDAVYLVISADGLLQEVDIDGKSIGVPRPIFETSSDIARRLLKNVPENATPQKVNPDSVIAVEMNPQGSLSFISQVSRSTESNPDRIVQVVNEVDFLAPAEDLTKNATAKAAVDAFTAALVAAGVVITSDELLKKGFTVMRVDGSDPADLTKQKINYDIVTVEIKDGEIGGDYPLMIKTEGGAWRDVLLADNQKIRIGGSVDGGDSGWQLESYKERTKEFNWMFPSGAFCQDTFDKYGNKLAVEWIQRANDNGQHIYIHSAFFHQDHGKIPTDINKYVSDRLNTLIGLSASIIKKPVMLNLANEMLWYYQGNSGLEDTNPLTMGNLSLADAYVMAFSLAQHKGLDVGTDIVFTYSDYDLYESEKRNVVVEYIIEQRKIIAQKLKLSEKDVNLTVGIQMRVDQLKGDPAKNGGRYPVPTKEAMEEMYTVFEKAGFSDVILTEVNIINASLDEKQDYFEDIFHIASEHKSPVLFESPLRMNDENNPNFFNGDFTKTSLYYQISKMLFAN